MMEEKDINTMLHVAGLIHKGRMGELTADEEKALKTWIADKDSNAVLYAELMADDYVENSLEHSSSPRLKAAIDNVYETIGFTGAKQPAPLRSIHFMRTAWFRSAVAMFLLITGAGAYFLLQQKAPQQPVRLNLNESLMSDIGPGKTGAILTLSDGTQVVLDSLQNGVVALQNGSQVLLDKGRLVYTDDSTALQAGSTTYNTMTTPRGRQFHLLLQDGTHVWLNSASSISYPTKFSGKERHVMITGEAYLEVAKNNKHPFKVSVNNKAEVEVLGTSFNVNAYENEGVIKATLLEGSIRTSIVAPGKPVVSAILKPGQQAQLTRNIKINPNTDIKRVMAWKSGVFNFEGVELREMMRQLERWYDISVVYEKGVPETRFIGEMSRDIKLSDLLIGLKGSGLNFRIAEGRKLILMPPQMRK